MARFSRKELIEILRKYSRKVGRTPMQNEVTYDVNLPPINQFYLVFGSWNNALRAANLKLNSINDYTDKELLLLLRKVYNDLGRVPKVNDLGTKNNLPSFATYYRHFGEFFNALQAAGIKSKKRKYIDLELLEILRGYYEKNKRTPRIKDFELMEEYPSPEVYKLRFGSWNEALKIAGLPIAKFNRRWTKKQLIYQLKKKTKQLGRTPTIRDMDKDPMCPGKNTYRKYFGNWTRALRAAKIQVRRFYSKKDLIRLMRKLASKLNKTPSKTEMNHTKGYPSETVFVKNFGSWNKAVIAAGLEVNKGFNNTNWEKWENLCISMARAVYKNIEVRKYYQDSGLKFYPDIYIPGKNKFIDAKLLGYKKFDKQVRRYTKKGLVEFWCIFKGVEVKSEKVGYVYAEELIRIMKSIKRYDLANECKRFLFNNKEQKSLIEGINY